MAKLFIGLALALALATAAVGFMAKGNIDSLQTTVKGAKQDLMAEQGKTRTAVTEKEAALKDKDAALAKAEESAKAAEAATADISAAKLQAQEAKMALEAKTKELADAIAAKAAMPVAPVLSTEPDPQIAVLQAENQKLAAEAAEAKKLAETMIEQGKANSDKVATLEREKKDREKGVQRPGLQGRILAVNSGWNFVVLSVGDKQGVLVNSSLLVVRGGEPVARLRVTSVEPSTAIADVIPGSVRRGITVQPGDNIIFEGRNAGNGTQSAAGTGAPSPALPN